MEQGCHFMTQTRGIAHKFQSFFGWFFPCYANLHLSLLVLLNLIDLGHNFGVLWGQICGNFFGFWSRRFEGMNRVDF